MEEGEERVEVKVRSCEGGGGGLCELAEFWLNIITLLLLSSCEMSQMDDI